MFNPLQQELTKSDSLISSQELIDLERVTMRKNDIEKVIYDIVKTTN